ncbi:MAG: hypothetical protein GF353_28265 [Candidatus Lokiarchaeota archaeon]|nr:hypothetical protein [Candidatus Lokiarchaeota archaeon]
MNGVENWCTQFNLFMLTFFIFLKYIFVLIMFSVGFLTLYKIRGIYLRTRQEKIDPEEDRLKKPRLVLGFFYIFMAFGILFDFFTYFLIIVLDPLPDRFVFLFINFNGDLDPYISNRFENIEKCKYPHEKTIYYSIALCSFFFTLNLILSIWYLINNNRVISNPRKVMYNTIYSVSGTILFGCTTFLPFFL